MRDNLWLEERLSYIWRMHFSDISSPNRVIIKFGKKSYRQLGSIKWVDSTGKPIKYYKAMFNYNRKVKPKPKNASSLITITSYFKDDSIPNFVVDATIAHEMCHYAHGFSSPLQQIYNHPHKGNVVGKELKKRGLGDTEKEAKKWLKTNWREVVTD
jgi:hypothetical protein